MYHGEFDKFDTIYLGGGTPSCLDTNDLKKILTAVKIHLDLCDDFEITMEANPSDIYPEKINIIRELNINKINLGVQSFDEAGLKLLGRNHSKDQAIKAIEDLRESQINNIGIDLIYGRPGQEIKDWLKELEQATLSNPDHISCYELTIEDKTLFSVKHKKNDLKLPDEELQAEFFINTSEFLQESGYLHYEVSNFAKGESNISRHNSKYWDHTPYLGLGPSAHSFDGKSRWWNFSSIKKYCQYLDKKKFPIEEKEALTNEQLFLEKISLELRTRRGVSIAMLEKINGWEETLEQLEKSGHIRFENKRIKPTVKGLLVADHLPLCF